MWELVNQSLRRGIMQFVEAVAEFVPVVLSLLVLLFLTAGFAWLVYTIVLHLSRRAGVDDRIARRGFSNMTEWSPGGSPARLFAFVAAGVVVFAGLIVAASMLEYQLASGSAQALVAYVPKVLVAILILIVAYPLSRFLARNVLISAVNAHVPSARLLSLSTKWMVLVIGAAMALQQLEIGGRIVALAFGILFGGIVLSAALAVGLGSIGLVRQMIEHGASREETERDPVHHL